MEKFSELSNLSMILEKLDEVIYAFFPENNQFRPDDFRIRQAGEEFKEIDVHLFINISNLVPENFGIRQVKVWGTRMPPGKIL